MSARPRFLKKLAKATAVAVAAIILGGAIFMGVAFYSNWSAGRNARVFCEAIPVGSAISAATAKADERKILWGADRLYRFYFPGAFFDKGICDVEVDPQGRVLRKAFAMLYD